ncbi:MAG: adhesin [Methanobrevibacter millerae]|uniref:Adhesin n=1 Tax=Methanobrevibacter millerae TaxID=230361 RepID=A0A8T3VEU0_9EURY|nr:NosD domain-containing protein [Methanobrevibacter millerae]MBE6506277.1 adhesin [Methanobrevibacter millerae]
MISLILICLFVLSFNVAFAANQTDEACIANSLDDSIVIDELLWDNISGKIIEINQDSYDNYFNKYTGEIRQDANINSGDILKIANITDRGFVIDRQLTLMPNSSSDQIQNGFIHLVKGSDGSIVTGLTINNTEAILSINSKEVGNLHGIWLSDTSNNTISYNIIRIANSGGVYALPMHSSNDNIIVYNDMKTYVSSNIIMGNSHRNFISRNKIEVLSYSDFSVTNLIYFSPFAFAGRLESALCEACTITYNELIGFSTLPMSIIIQAVYANHENTIIANNTIYKGSYGINLIGDNAQVYGNDVDGSAIGIAVNGANISVCDNTIHGNSQKTGLAVYGEDASTGVVSGNVISFEDVENALIVGSKLNVYNNIVNIGSYGHAIAIVGNYSNVHDNKAKSSYDDAVTFLGNENTIDSNIIITNARGISITTSGLNRYYNNTISNNKITSDSYGIYLNGLVYYTTIASNVIETNASVGIYKEITDAVADDDFDNMVNGVIYDATALVINDDNFYDYFDENGYLNYTFKENRTKSIFFTFLSNKDIFFNEKINVISNKQNNLLFNVTITFEEDSSGSLIRDFNFMNYNKNAIVLDNVNDVNVAKNNITLILNKKSDYDSAIFVCGVGDDNIISGNNIYINSKIDYAYGISISSYNPSSYKYNREFSRNFQINDNTIIMITSKMGEAIFSDAIVESEVIGNKINIISKDCGYGIAAVNVIGQLYGWNISDNEIIIHAEKMAYLIELHMSESMNVEKNYLFSNSGGSYGIAAYLSNNISIINNTFDIFGKNISMDKVFDVIGAGDAAVFISGDCENVSVINNTIYSNATNPIKIDGNESFIDLITNVHVISDINYDVYFKPELDSSIVKANDTLLLNLSDNQKLIVNIPVNISGYKANLANTIELIINSSSNITDILLKNSTVHLNNVSNASISHSVFNDTLICIDGGYANCLIDNVFNSDSDVIKLENSEVIILNNNLFNINGSSKAISAIDSHDIFISNNNFTGICDDVIFIYSLNSHDSIIDNNILSGNASSIFGYYGLNSSNNMIMGNEFRINGKSPATNQSGVYLTRESSNNYVFDNKIFSTSLNADDYAVMIISDRNLSNRVTDNYLISGNGSKRSNAAVYSKYDTVADNTPFNIFVSINGSDIYGDGSQSNPFASISHALKNALNHAIIYVSKGIYFEYDLNINNNITLSGTEDGVIIDADFNQLFNISKRGILTVNGMTFRNAHNVDGGALFINNGVLIIRNSTLCNSSSYYDNSNPIFDNNVSENEAYTIDCRDEGKGGAILNYGNLIIDNSFIYGNLAHIGGAIADYGKTSINSSVLYANHGVHGGAIYTDSDSSLTVNNTLFYDNSAIVTFNYCMVRKAVSTWSVTGVTYSYTSRCSLPVGEGGAIYTNRTDLIIDNSVFNRNSAYKGGAIATKYVSASARSKSDVDLTITNSSFINNRANDTKIYKDNDLVNNYNYNNNHDGGAIYGAFNKFRLYSSDFIDNQAVNDAGAVYAQSGDALIDLCNFIGNRAGSSSGALFISNNFLITRTVISNNSARYGGALTYDSYFYYGHVQNNLNIYNSTITNNMALIAGGAMRIGQANVTIHYSNIYDNFAPESSTISSSYITSDSSRVLADMRYNYWGPTQLNGRAANADNSVYNFPNVRMGSRLREYVTWIVQKEDNDDPVTPVNTDDGDNTPSGTTPVSTNTHSSTGTSIGGGNGNSGGYSGDVIGPSGNSNKQGSNMGYGEGGQYDGPGALTPIGNIIDDAVARGINIPVPVIPNTNTGNPEFIYQDIPSYETKNTNDVNTQNGSAEGNSVSRENSSQFDESLDTFGLVANAMSSASSSAGESSSGESQQSSSSSNGGKSYELDEKSVDKKIDDNKTIIMSLIAVILMFLLLILGYKRKRDDEY